MPREISAQRLVGRRTEIERLHALCRGDAATTVAVVGGDAGIGKTRLLETLTARLREDGVTVLVGACLDLGDAAPAFSPLPEAFGALAGAATPPPSAPPELAMLVPSLPADGSPLVEGTRLRIFQAVASYLDHLARDGRVVLVLEDLHWADSSTRELIAFLARTLTTGPVAVVASYRADDLHRRHPLRSTLAELDRAGTVEHVALGPLSVGEVGELLRELMGRRVAGHVAEDIHDRTEGNPFYVEELVASGTLLGRLPTSLTDLILVRVDGLPHGQRRVLDAASVVGREVDHAILAELADEDDLDEHVRGLLDAGLLVVPGDGAGGLRFRHALLQEAVHERLLPWERAALHERVVSLLTTRPDLTVAGGRTARLAVHAEAAGDDPAALRARLDAAMEAAAARTFDEAALHAEAVMRLWPRVDDPEGLTGVREVELLRLAADWHFVAGRGLVAERIGRRVLELLGPDAPDVERALALERIGRYRYIQLEGDKGLESYRAAAALLPVTAPDVASARVLAGLAQLCSLEDLLDEARQAAERALVHARAAGERALEGHALNTLGQVSSILGDVEGGLAMLDRAMAIALDRADLEDVLRAYTNKGHIMHVLGRHDEAVAISREGADVAGRHGAHVFRRILLANALLANLGAGRVDAAAACALEIGGAHLASTWVRAIAAALALSTGDLDAIEQLLGDVDPATEPLHAAQDGDLGVLVRLEAWWWQGRSGDAREGVAAVVARRDEVRHTAWWAGAAAIGLRVEADDREPDTPRDEVARRERVDALLDLASAAVAASDLSAIGRVWLPGWVALAEAEHGRAVGKGDVDAWIAAATALSRASPLPHLPAYAWWRAAEQAASEGDRGRASALAHTAATRADAARAAHVRERLDVLVRAARLDPGDTDVDTAAADEPTTAPRLLDLTAREREVLTLVAAGRSNGQIGEELFISRKTASVHVSNILRKLGAANRVEAAMIAVRSGLAPDDPPLSRD